MKCIWTHDANERYLPFQLSASIHCTWYAAAKSIALYWNKNRMSLTYKLPLNCNEIKQQFLAIAFMYPFNTYIEMRLYEKQKFAWIQFVNSVMEWQRNMLDSKENMRCHCILLYLFGQNRGKLYNHFSCVHSGLGDKRTSNICIQNNDLTCRVSRKPTSSTYNLDAQGT